MMVNIADAKAKLSELVEAAGHGEQVIICNRNEPVAELRAIETARTTPRDLTALYSDWTIVAAFFDPLADEDVDAWYAGDAAKGGRAAESTAAYTTRRGGRRSRR